MPVDLFLIGGGGHCKSCIDVIEAKDDFKIQGVVEAEDAAPNTELPYPVIGFDSQLEQLIKQTPHCLLTIGQIKNADTRRQIFEQLQLLGAKMPIILSPHAYVSSTARIGKGTIVMHQALINAFVRVGDNCIINSQALIEHDCVIGDHCHISTGAKINGGVSLGNGCFIGSGSVIKQGVSLADKVIIGANSTVLNNIYRPGVYKGLLK